MTGHPEGNGILAGVPGVSVASGSRDLPPAETAPQDSYTVEIDADWAGRVRITYVRKQYKTHKHRYWGWHAVRAEKVD